MSIRKAATILSLSLAAFAAPAAYASTGTTPVGGERGAEHHASGSGLTRAQVQREFLEFRKNPRTHDGLLFVGGETGEAEPRQLGRLPSAAAAGAPLATPAPLSERERRLMREQYAN